MNRLTCHGCVHLKDIALIVPHDKIKNECVHRKWGGYANPDHPACEISRNGKRVLAGFLAKGKEGDA